MTPEAKENQIPHAGGGLTKTRRMTDRQLLAAWDPENPQKSVSDLATRTGKSEQEIQQSLADGAIAAAGRVATRWWKKEGIPLVLVCLILIPVVVAVIHWEPRVSSVIAKRDLPPYQTLTASDVETSQTIAAAESVTDVSQIDGHYLRKTVSAGKAILKSDLSGTSALGLKDRSIVEIPFRAGAVQPTSAQRCVSVLFTSKTGGKENPTATGVWLLGVRQEKDADWVAMAVPTADLGKINAAISGYDPMLAVPATPLSKCDFAFIGSGAKAEQGSVARPKATRSSLKKSTSH